MTRIAIRPIKGRGPPRERVNRAPSLGLGRVQKTPEELEEKRQEVFRKSGCRRQYAECPQVQSYENPVCRVCPHFPEKFRNE